MENIKIFEKNFKLLMKNKDFVAFNKEYPTLMNVIMKSMNEAVEVNSKKCIDNFTCLKGIEEGNENRCNKQCFTCMQFPNPSEK